jgi:hypothetical protein
MTRPSGLLVVIAFAIFRELYSLTIHIQQLPAAPSHSLCLRADTRMAMARRPVQIIYLIIIFIPPPPALFKPVLLKLYVKLSMKNRRKELMRLSSI